MFKWLSWNRFIAVVGKEFVQMRRDRLTFAMMLGVPLMQLILFGYAINSDPKHLPTAIVRGDVGMFERSYTYALKNSSYFDIQQIVSSEAEARKLIESGEVLFVVNFPPGFTQSVLRGEHPSILMEADATDPIATGSAVSAMRQLGTSIFDRYFVGPLSHLKGQAPIIDLNLQRLYNPEGRSQDNIVPGLMGVVLTMTMVMITALSITRERERGTMETLLSTPVRPAEVMVGKIVPYIMVGFIQVLFILIAARFLFGILFVGNLLVLSIAAFVFIAANLSVGVTLSTVAQNQLQALQLSFFFFLPSIFLSGFMFPFKGMPLWAQYLGSVLPLTHFLRIVRGVLLKGISLVQVGQHLWPILLFMVVVMTFGLKRYRKTLD